MNLDSFTTFETDAAKVLDFHNYDKANILQMAEDLENLHSEDNMYTDCIERFEQLSEYKMAELKRYVEALRGISTMRRNLTEIMTEAKVEKKLIKFDHDDEAIKEWFYELFPSQFRRADIEKRHRKAVKHIYRNKINELSESDFLRLLKHTALWMEYHEWEWEKCKDEILQDLFESINDLTEDRVLRLGRPPVRPEIDERTCIRALLDYKGDPDEALKQVPEDRGELDDMIEDARDLNEMLFDILGRMRNRVPPETNAKAELSDLTKLFFTEFWNDFTAEAIRKYVKNVHKNNRF